MPRRFSVSKDENDNLEHVVHNTVPVEAQGADPALEASIGHFYGKTVSARVEAFFQDDTGVATQLTSQGVVLVPPETTLTPSKITGATNITTATIDTELVIGGFVFDPALYLGALAIEFQAQALLSTADVAGNIEIRLYDMGPGTGAFVPVLRSVLLLTQADADEVISLSQSLLLVASPGIDADEIHDVARAYELRIYLEGSDTPTAQITWSGLSVVETGTGLTSGTSAITAATNQTTSVQTTEQVIGGFTFDPTVFATPPSMSFRAQMELTTADVAGFAELRLYDMGPGNAAFVPVLRSTIAITFTEAGFVYVASKNLRLDAAPGVDADQLFDTLRTYELRLFLDTSDAGSIDVAWAGLLLGARPVGDVVTIINATTTGTSPTYVLTPVPEAAGYVSFIRYQVTFHQATAVASTLNISGLGALSLKQYDDTGAKVDAVIAVDQVSDVIYDGTDLVLLNPLPSAGGGGGATSSFVYDAGSPTAGNSYATFAGVVAAANATGGQCTVYVVTGFGDATLNTVAAHNVSKIDFVASPGTNAPAINFNGATLLGTTRLSLNSVRMFNSSASPVLSTVSVPCDVILKGRASVTAIGAPFFLFDNEAIRVVIQDFSYLENDGAEVFDATSINSSIYIHTSVPLSDWFDGWNQLATVNCDLFVDDASMAPILTAWDFGFANTTSRLRSKGPVYLEPSPLSGTVHDFFPDNLESADIIRVTLSGAVSMTGLQAPGNVYPKRIMIINADTADTLTLQHQNVGSQIGYRFLNNTGAALAVGPNGIAQGVYDVTSNCWRMWLV